MKKVLLTLTGIIIVYSLSAQASGKVRDIDGNEYSTIIVGKQEWMVENLKTTRLNDGRKIPGKRRGGYTSSTPPARGRYLPLWTTLAVVADPGT